MINISNLYMQKAIKVLYCLLFIGFYSCNSGDNLENMAAYINEHQTDLERMVSGKELTTLLKYIPCDMAAARDFELSGGRGIDFDTFKKDYQETLEFSFSIKGKDGNNGIQKRIKDSKEKEFMVTYYNYQANNDIMLVAGTDTIPCTYLHAIQAGGIKDELLFSVGFNKTLLKDKETITVLFFDRIFGKDIFQYPFDMKALENTPKISHYSSTFSK